MATKAPTPFELIGGGVRRLGRVIKSGLNKVGTKVADDLFGSPAKNQKQKEQGEKINEVYSGRVRRSTSDGSIGR